MFELESGAFRYGFVMERIEDGKVTRRLIDWYQGAGMGCVVYCYDKPKTRIVPTLRAGLALLEEPRAV